MQLRPDQLPQQLKQSLAPIYIVAGEEPLLVHEAAEAIRAAAKQAGFAEREWLGVEAGFDWDQLSQSTENFSLFSTQRLVELNLPEGKAGREGGKALSEAAKNPDPDTLLLVVADGAASAVRKTAWFKAIEKAGASVFCWPVDVDRLPNWIAGRMKSSGLNATREAINELAHRCEGNLMAAAQDVQKLSWLNIEGQIDVAHIREVVADNARFDIFDLPDKALSGDTAAALRTLYRLRDEGVDPVPINWALTRDVRALGNAALSGGGEDALRAQRVFSSRIPLFRKTLSRMQPGQLRRLMQRCALIDRASKGRSQQRLAWEELVELLVDLSGRPATAPSLELE